MICSKYLKCFTIKNWFCLFVWKNHLKNSVKRVLLDFKITELFLIDWILLNDILAYIEVSIVLWFSLTSIINYINKNFQVTITISWFIILIIIVLLDLMLRLWLAFILMWDCLGEFLKLRTYSINHKTRKSKWLSSKLGFFSSLIIYEYKTIDFILNIALDTSHTIFFWKCPLVTYSKWSIIYWSKNNLK